jgi:hypothetical protein
VPNSRSSCLDYVMGPGMAKGWTGRERRRWMGSLLTEEMSG